MRGSARRAGFEETGAEALPAAPVRWERLVEIVVPDDDNAPRYRKGERVSYDPGAEALAGEDVVVLVPRRRPRIATLIDAGRLRLTLLQGRRPLHLAPGVSLRPIRARRPA